jgi:2-polyprenyl-3-methyl-5-hydroxy-6-metoxy-1,4-benzoquinol methylase
VASTDAGRAAAFGADRSLTSVDRFGIWLSQRSIRRAVGDFAGKRVADLGCGHEATLVRTLLPSLASATLVDITLGADLKHHPKIHAIEGTLPDAICDLPTASFDVVLCISSLEHLSQPDVTAAECRRLLAPGGVFLVNVPNWLGKRFLEFSAFRLGLSPAEEMDDHKMYYDPKDLWPLLRRAGFLPHNIRCFRHKGGLNTFAVCRTEPDAPGQPG